MNSKLTPARTPTRAEAARAGGGGRSPDRGDARGAFAPHAALTHRAECSSGFRELQKRDLGEFQHLDRLLAGDGWEII